MQLRAVVHRGTELGMVVLLSGGVDEGGVI